MMVSKILHGVARMAIGLCSDIERVLLDFGIGVIFRSFHTDGKTECASD